MIANFDNHGLLQRSLVIVNKGKYRAMPRLSHVQENGTVVVPTQEEVFVGVEAAGRKTYDTGGKSH